MANYYIVDKKILPEAIEKVVEARSLLQKKEVQKISDAVKKVGISRATYYKYRDFVFLPSNTFNARKAVISMKLQHESGILSQILDSLSTCQTNIITIHQNIPIHNIATVVISFDFESMNVTMDQLLLTLREIQGVIDLQLEAIE